jgi:hypothetical protein
MLMAQQPLYSLRGNTHHTQQDCLSLPQCHATRLGEILPEPTALFAREGEEAENSSSVGCLLLQARHTSDVIHVGREVEQAQALCEETGFALARTSQ